MTTAEIVSWAVENDITVLEEIVDRARAEARSEALEEAIEAYYDCPEEMDIDAAIRALIPKETRWRGQDCSPDKTRGGCNCCSRQGFVTKVVSGMEIAQPCHCLEALR